MDSQNNKKCYIVTYDKKINNYKRMLSLLEPTSYSTYNNDTVHKNKIKENNNLKSYLNNIDSYLDEILSTPGITDEDIFNLKNDQRDILTMMNDVENTLNTLNTLNKTNTYIKET